MDLPDKVYSKRDLENARTKGQVMGWVQGGGLVVGGLMLLKLMPLIPMLLVVGGVGYVGYRLFFKSSSNRSSSVRDELDL